MIRRLLVLLALAWTLGFGWFMLTLPGPADARHTDAIVVLTGGAGRIDRGLDLLKARAARRLLVTGVGTAVRPIDLALHNRASPALFACCVDLGHEAVDTRSNAEETSAWLRAHGYKSVRLVTSDWHLRRAKMELEAALGRSGVVVLGDGVPGHPKAPLLLAEYNKFLIRRVALWLGLDV